VSADYGEAIAYTLEGLIQAGVSDSEIGTLSSWDFGQLFKCIDQHVDTIGLDRVTRIEWYFFPALGFDPPTTTLHRRLADDPNFFAQIVSLAYRGRADVDAGIPLDPDRDQRPAQNAYGILDSWSVPPGLGKEGNFDATRCEAWIADATHLLEEADRRVVGRLRIGQILTYAPAGDEGWPSEAVAEIIERLDDDKIDNGARTEIQNQRGVTTRGVAEGGDQERALAAKYRACASRFVYTAPRVARLLNDIAQQYKHEAHEHDSEAERFRRGLDP
jgi:hypothetical protein